MRAIVLALLVGTCFAIGPSVSSAELKGDEAWLEEARKVPAGDAKPSSGCSSGAGVGVWSGNASDTSYEGWVNISIPDFVVVNRSFWIQVPSKVGPKSTPAPMLVSFHGQGGTADDQANSHFYGFYGSSLGYVSVFPQGIDDAPSANKDEGTGWNVGTAADNQTCIAKQVGEDGACYDSCKKLGRCGSCNWSSCYNEKLFVQRVIEAVASVLCIDMTRLYVNGESNGGMLTHYLVQEMPGYFAAAVPWYGLPLLGYALGDSYSLVRNVEKARQTAMLQFHDRQDELIPVAGGIADGWIYEPLNKVQQGWAAIHSCDPKSTPVSTYFDGGNTSVSCVHYVGCGSGKKVMRCLYDGQHGDWPGGGDGTAPDVGEKATIWFMMQFRLGSTQTNGGSAWAII